MLMKYIRSKQCVWKVYSVVNSYESENEIIFHQTENVLPNNCAGVTTFSGKLYYAVTHIFFIADRSTKVWVTKKTPLSALVIYVGQFFCEELKFTLIFVTEKIGGDGVSVPVRILLQKKNTR